MTLEEAIAIIEDRMTWACIDLCGDQGALQVVLDAAKREATSEGRPQAT